MLLPAGVYLYTPQSHLLSLVTPGDQRNLVGKQPQMQNAPKLIAYTADNAANAKRAGEKMAEEWAALEVGHSAQNVLLEEVALGMAGVVLRLCALRAFSMSLTPP